MKAPRRPKRLRPAVKLIVGLAAMVVLGTLLLLAPGVSRGNVSPSDAAFTASSALSVTGLSVIVPSQDLTLVGQIVLMLLMQVGGLGYMVFAVATFRLLGKSVGLEDRLALQDSLGLLDLGGLLELVGHVLRTVLLIELAGAVALWLHWRSFMPDGQAAWYGVFHSVSAFCNAGFDLFSGHPEHMEGMPRDPGTLAIFGSLIFLGGLGIPVLFDFATWRRRKQLSLHTRITVPVVLTLVVVGALAIYVSEARPGGTLDGLPPGRASLLSLFQSVSCRSGGMAGLPNFEGLQPATLVSICGLMFIGGAPASMGGGITTGTFSVLVLSLVAYARGRDVAVFKGRAIPNEMVRRASSVLSVSIFVVLLAIWSLALTQRLSLSKICFEVVSAFSTCGLSLGATSELNDFGRAVVALIMFWGRLGALTILVGLAKADHPRLIEYPEEKILIG